MAMDPVLHGDDVSQATVDLRADAQDIWVFAYGSLMWNPGFPFAAAHPALLTGYHRAFCVYSVYYRGTPERPGLVLGLDRGGTCQGLALRVRARDGADVLAYLRRREQITGIYRETRVPLELTRHVGKTVSAYAFVVERCHPGYAPALTATRQAQIIRAARGRAGPNLDYALQTIAQLHRMGRPQADLDRLSVKLGSLFSMRGVDQGAMGVRPGAGQTLWHHLRRFAPIAPRVKIDQRKRFLYRDRLQAF